MEITNSKLDQTLKWLTYGTLLALALALVTSTSLLALSHILMLLPALYFLNKADYKKFPLSAWALLAMTIVIALSVVFNQDIADKGYKPIMKAKYFLYGFISIAPFWYLKEKQFITEKRLKILLYLFCVSTSIATIAGIVGMKTGYNYISMRAVNTDRNAGLSGMVLNYAHNLSFFLVIIAGLLLNAKKLEKIISPYFLAIVFALNLAGLYLSYTRGAIIALVAGLLFFFFKKHTKTFLVAVVLVCLAFAGMFYTSTGIVRKGSDKERISQWKAAVMAFKERPVLGYGYLNFENHSVEIKERYGIGELQFGGHAHNNFLEMLASTGIIGFLCYVVWMLSWFIELYKKNDLTSQIGLALIAAITVSGLTQSTIALGVNLFFIMAVYSLTVYQKNSRENHVEHL